VDSHVRSLDMLKFTTRNNITLPVFSESGFLASHARLWTAHLSFGDASFPKVFGPNLASALLAAEGLTLQAVDVHAKIGRVPPEWRQLDIETMVKCRDQVLQQPWLRVGALIPNSQHDRLEWVPNPEGEALKADQAWDHLVHPDCQSSVMSNAPLQADLSIVLTLGDVPRAPDNFPFRLSDQSHQHPTLHVWIAPAAVSPPFTSGMSPCSISCSLMFSPHI